MRRPSYWKQIVAAAVAVAAFGVYSFAFAAGVAQKSTLNGVVQADGLVKAGQSVSQGDVLVKVKTIMGAAPAARATVKAVYVTAGQQIAGGQIVAEIEP